jgi:hypothetical protein
MLRPIFVLLICGTTSAGCNGIVFDEPTIPDVGGSSGLVTWSSAGDARTGIDNASIYHLGTCFVIWSDLPNGGGGSTSSNHQGITCQGRLHGANGELIEFYCESKDGKSGRATIDGQPFDLQHGSLFLVSSDGATCRVRQLDADIAGLKFDRESLQDYAAQHMEFEEFFGKTQMK